MLGLDGVPWPLLEEWAAAGDLPNFARVIEEGAAGPLQSTTPASTPLAWPSIATGVWPDQHGIYSFQHVTPEYTHEMYTRTDIRQPQLWDICSPAVVGNVPMTYPVEEIDGKMVGGMMSPEINEDYTHPPELAATIRSELPNYEISLNWAEYFDDQDRIVADITALLEARRELMRLLMDTGEWELFFFTYTEPDRLQHLIWDREILLDHYRKLDRILGEVIEYVAAADGTLFVVSDHGFGPIDKRITPNATLEAEGLLRRERPSGTGSLLERVGLTKDRLRDTLDRVGLDEDVLIKKYLPRSLVDRLAATVPGDHYLYDLEHAETQAFAHEFGNLYINDTERFTDGAVDPAAVPEVKAELVSVLESLTDPETGEAVLDVHDGDDVFPRDPDSPDLVLEPASGYAVSFSLSEEPFVEPQADADHESEGVFLAWGPAIEAASRPTAASVVDVAPTVLHHCGYPIPHRADGRVLTEIFATDIPEAEIDTHAYDRAGEDRTVEEDFEDVQERLKGLGYME